LTPAIHDFAATDGGTPSGFELDGLDPAEFAARVAPLFEGALRFLDRLAEARPVDSWDRLFERAREIAHEMPEADQIELIDAHPRLGAPPTSVSELSFREQGYDREAVANRASEAAWERDRLAAELDRLNHAYETRFGFRYCVFVAGRSRSELLPEMALALGRDRDSEIHRALDAVVDIAADRRRTLAAAATAAVTDAAHIEPVAGTGADPHG
jgi:2-oxo-4-hydroxy-4-carboxy-5-ureidoimidazoline decarboxylase